MGRGPLECEKCRSSCRVYAISRRLRRARPVRALSLQDLVQSSELQIAGTIFAPRLSVQSRPAIVGSGVVGIAGQPSTSVMPAATRLPGRPRGAAAVACVIEGSPAESLPVPGVDGK